MSNIPDGYCQCGCGKKTNIMAYTHKPRGRIKGNYYRYAHGHNSKQDLEERVWGHINIGNPNECWEWVGGKNKDGYGRLNISGRIDRAHRVVYRLANGDIPPNKIILHSCNNPSCCNPNHLRAGTYKENTHDMMVSGRNRNKVFRGSESSVSKLTESQVLNMRQEYNSGGISIGKLARKYSISESQCSRIVKRQSWTHI
jgi:hypothetical protein